MKHKYFLSAPLLLCISFLLLCSELGKAYEIPPCSCVPLIFVRTNEQINIDTTFVFDTCGIDIHYNSCDSTFYKHWISKSNLETDRRMKAKGPYWLLFEFPAIKMPKYPDDTLIVLHWQDIDTIYSEVRAKFNSIEKEFGGFHFIKLSPFADTGRASQQFILEYDNWMIVALGVAVIIADIPNTKCEFWGGPHYTNTKVLDDQSVFTFSLNTNNTNLHISSNAEPIINYAIYNLQGNAISQSNNINYQDALDIDISALSNGIYFLRINSHFSKFIINR